VMRIIITQNIIITYSEGQTYWLEVNYTNILRKLTTSSINRNIQE
jgi:hypothetical protein